MCDPVSMVVGAVAGNAVVGALSKPKSPKYADPTAERMKAEAEATASANAKLRQTQLRRREQQSLIAKGAPSLGDENTTGDSPISPAQRMVSGGLSPFRTTPDVLMARGAGGGASLPGLTPSGGRKRISPPPARAY